MCSVRRTILQVRNRGLRHEVNTKDDCRAYRYFSTRRLRSFVINVVALRRFTQPRFLAHSQFDMRYAKIRASHTIIINVFMAISQGVFSLVSKGDVSYKILFKSEERRELSLMVLSSYVPLIFLSQFF